MAGNRPLERCLRCGRANPALQSAACFPEFTFEVQCMSPCKRNSLERRAVAFCVFDEPVCPGIETFACSTRCMKCGHAWVENLYAAFKVVHSKVDVGEQIDFVDD